jgi:hypothetical protein
MAARLDRFRDIFGTITYFTSIEPYNLAVYLTPVRQAVGDDNWTEGQQETRQLSKESQEPSHRDTSQFSCTVYEHVAIYTRIFPGNIFHG